MGYYSDAALAVRKRDFDRMLIRAKQEPDPDELLRFLTRNADHYAGGDPDDPESPVVLYWSFIKWYEEFPDIRYVEDWMAGKYGDGFGFAFIRIGEGDDDVEERYGDSSEDLCGYISVTREIQFLDVAPFQAKIPNDDPDEEIEAPDPESIRTFLGITAAEPAGEE